MPISIDEADISKVTIDGTSVREVTIDGNVAYALENTVDNFEDTTWSEYTTSGLDSGPTQNTSDTQDGNGSLEFAGSLGKGPYPSYLVSTSGLPNYFSPGQEMTFDFKRVDDECAGMVYFGVTSETGDFGGYALAFGADAEKDDSFGSALYRLEGDGSWTNLSDGGGTKAPGAWGTETITWETDGTITFDYHVFNVTDTTYTASGVGFGVFTDSTAVGITKQVRFDNVYTKPL